MTAGRMKEERVQVVVGDRLRLSVALLREWYDRPGHESPLVRLAKIERADDGSLVLHLDRVDEDA